LTLAAAAASAPFNPHWPTRRTPRRIANASWRSSDGMTAYVGLFAVDL